MTAEPSRLRDLASSRTARFALIGAVNTGFGYGVFVLLELAVREKLPYLVVLLASYVLGVSEAFVLQRRFVFRHEGPWLSAYLRFWSVYLVSLGVNLALLPLLVEVVGVPVLLAQLLVLVLAAAGSYLAHSRFSFRSSAPV